MPRAKVGGSHSGPSAGRKIIAAVVRNLPLERARPPRTTKGLELSVPVKN